MYQQSRDAPGLLFRAIRISMAMRISCSTHCKSGTLDKDIFYTQQGLNLRLGLPDIWSKDQPSSAGQSGAWGYIPRGRGQ